jgi:hypothetical protein
MKPKPLDVLKNLTVPVFILFSFVGGPSWRHRASSFIVRTLVIVRFAVPRTGERTIPDPERIGMKRVGHGCDDSAH